MNHDRYVEATATCRHYLDYIECLLQRESALKHDLEVLKRTNEERSKHVNNLLREQRRLERELEQAETEKARLREAHRMSQRVLKEVSSLLSSSGGQKQLALSSLGNSLLEEEDSGEDSERVRRDVMAAVSNFIRTERTEETDWTDFGEQVEEIETRRTSELWTQNPQTWFEPVESDPVSEGLTGRQEEECDDLLLEREQFKQRLSDVLQRRLINNSQSDQQQHPTTENSQGAFTSDEAGPKRTSCGGRENRTSSGRREPWDRHRRTEPQSQETRKKEPEQRYLAKRHETTKRQQSVENQTPNEQDLLPNRTREGQHWRLRRHDVTEQPSENRDRRSSENRDRRSSENRDRRSSENRDRRSSENRDRCSSESEKEEAWRHTRQCETSSSVSTYKETMVSGGRSMLVQKVDIETGDLSESTEIQDRVPPSSKQEVAPGRKWTSSNETDQSRTRGHVRSDAWLLTRNRSRAATAPNNNDRSCHPRHKPRPSYYINRESNISDRTEVIPLNSSRTVRRITVTHELTIPGVQSTKFSAGEPLASGFTGRTEKTHRQANPDEREKRKWKRKHRKRKEHEGTVGAETPVPTLPDDSNREHEPKPRSNDMTDTREMAEEDLIDVATMPTQERSTTTLIPAPDEPRLPHRLVQSKCMSLLDCAKCQRRIKFSKFYSRCSK
ncbi:unnamed protein product, partial [Cyprideis torosa]